MKKKYIQIIISLFWGINFLLLMIYALINELVELIRGKKEKIVDNPDYDRQFRTLTLVPLITSIVLILIIFLTDYGFFDIFPVILTVYGIGVIICVVFILFTPNSIIYFDKDATSILTTYKQFGIFMVLDVGVMIARIFFWGVTYTNFTIFIINSVSLLVLAIFLLQFWSVMKEERENIQVMGAMEEKLEFNSKNYSQLHQNIMEIQDLIVELTSEEKIEEATGCLKNIFRKSGELVNIAKKGKKYKQLSEANIIQRKIEKQLYEFKIKKDMVNFEAKFEDLKKAKNFDESAEYNQIRQEMITLLNDTLAKAKKIRHRKEMTKLTGKLQRFKKEFPER
ncbi:MAG: hypothetical protein ACTSYU_07905 [Promethearchaeota archaeon]